MLTDIVTSGPFEVLRAVNIHANKPVEKPCSPCYRLTNLWMCARPYFMKGLLMEIASKLAKFATGLLLASTFVSIPQAASAATADGFEYTVNASNEAIILGCSSQCPTNLVIPSALAGHDVVEIRYEAFIYQNLASVSLPETLRVIGNAAFDMNDLTTITIPSSVTAVGNFFLAFNRLTEVKFLGNAPADVTLPFLGNANLAQITVSAESTGWGSNFGGIPVVAVSTSIFAYTTDLAGEVTISGCASTCPVDLVIPASIGGNPVTAIAERAFENLNQIETLS